MNENRNRWGWVQAATVTVMLVLVLVLGYYGYRLISEWTSSSHYLSVLTLAVTILLVSGALIGGASIWTAFRIRDVMTQTRYQVMDTEKEHREAIKREEEKLNELRGRAESNLNALELLIRYYQLIGSAYGTFHPTGLSLASAVRNLSKIAERSECECRFTMQDLVRKLAMEIEKNALIGAQVLRLFLSPDSNGIKSSAMALVAERGEEARKLLQRRLELEKQMPKPDPELIAFLAESIGMFSDSG